MSVKELLIDLWAREDLGKMVYDVVLEVGTSKKKE